MRIIFYIVRKEFKQIFRNKGMLPIIFVMPVIQLLILSNAATFEVKNIKLSILDEDHSSYSRELVGKFKANSYFNIVDYPDDFDEAQKKLEDGASDLVIQIPNHFERDLLNNKKATIGITIDAIDGVKASVEYVYSNFIILDFNRNIMKELLTPSDLQNPPKQINVSQLFWFNPELNYKTFMVPGILVLLVTMVSIFLSGMNIVREKEIGTLEQINVTPIKKYQFIIGKLLPFWLLGLFELAFGLMLGILVFKIPVLGSFFTIFLFASIYLLVVLGMGLFISNFTQTQQQAMFLSWFFMVIFILMSGLFTPIESMPEWAQKITEFNPIRYFVEVMRMVMLKGAHISDITSQIIKISIYAFVINGLAVWSYRKSS